MNSDQYEIAIFNFFSSGITKQSFGGGGNPEPKPQKGVWQQVFMQFLSFHAFY